METAVEKIKFVFCSKQKERQHQKSKLNNRNTMYSCIYHQKTPPQFLQLQRVSIKFKCFYYSMSKLFESHDTNVGQVYTGVGTVYRRHISLQSIRRFVSNAWSNLVMKGDSYFVRPTDCYIQLSAPIGVPVYADTNDLLTPAVQPLPCSLLLDSSLKFSPPLAGRDTPCCFLDVDKITFCYIVYRTLHVH